MYNAEAKSAKTVRVRRMFGENAGHARSERLSCPMSAIPRRYQTVVLRLHNVRGTRFAVSKREWDPPASLSLFLNDTSTARG